MKDINDLETFKTVISHVLDKTENGVAELQPWTCKCCPFNAKTVDPKDEFANDPSEAYYACPVLDCQIWGEDPKCHDFMHSAVVKALHTVKKAILPEQD